MELLDSTQARIEMKPGQVMVFFTSQTNAVQIIGFFSDTSILKKITQALIFLV